MHHAKFNGIVEKLLALYGGGREYFDNLDAEIRAIENLDIVQALFAVPLNHVVVSGNFGAHVRNLRAQGKIKIYGELIHFAGGLRHGKAPDILYSTDSFMPATGYTFVDDSFYKGRTMRAIDAELKRFGGFVRNVVVAYDGSLTKRDDVRSLYRYHP